MNENHAYDKALLEKVERLLHEGRASGDDLLDSLAVTQPQARADFRQALEDQVIAQLRLHQEEQKQMTAYPELALPKTRRNFRLPVTLAAALVMMIAAISLFSSIRPPTQSGFAAQVETSTPLPTSVPDDIALTATAIIAGATGTAEVNQTAAVEPIFLTATAIVAGATGSAEASIIHVVQPGDTLAAIALVYGVEVEVLRAVNNLTVDTLEVGYRLIIPQTEAPAVPLDVTATPIPPTVPPRAATAGAELQPAVVARFPLPAYTRLTEDMLTVIYWPAGNAPVGSTGEISTLVGKYLQADMRAWQPVTSRDVGDTPRPPHLTEQIALPMIEQIVLPNEGWTMTLDTNAAFTSIAVTITDERLGALQPGDTISITSAFIFRENEDQSRIQFQPPPASPGQIAGGYGTPVSRGEIVSIENGLLTMRAATHESAELSHALDDGLPLTLHFAAADASAASPVLPEGTIAVSLPLDAVAAAESGLQVGAVVDVQAGMLFVDVDEQFQAGEVILADQITAGQTPQFVMQVIAQGVQVIEIGAGMITLAAAPQDAIVLQWAVEAKLPLTVSLSGAENIDESQIATPIPFMTSFERVIVTLTDIAEGELLNDDEMTVYTAFWLSNRKPAQALESLPFNARAARSLNAGEILREGDVTGAPVPTRTPGNIRHDWPGLFLPESQVTNAAEVQKGNRVAVHALLIGQNGIPQARMVIADAEVVIVPGMAFDSQTDRFMLSVSPTDSVLLNWLVEAGIPLTLSPVG